MYKASIFWYSMRTWDHWEFQLWNATWHDFQELDFVQRVKAKRTSCKNPAGNGCHLKLGAHRRIMLRRIWRRTLWNGIAIKKAVCGWWHSTSWCSLVSKNKIDIIFDISPYLAQRYLAQPRGVAVCACLHLMVQHYSPSVAMQPIT
jgi:hypothetical protein